MKTKSCPEDLPTYAVQVLLMSEDVVLERHVKSGSHIFESPRASNYLGYYYCVIGSMRNVRYPILTQYWV